MYRASTLFCVVGALTSPAFADEAAITFARIAAATCGQLPDTTEATAALAKQQDFRQEQATEIKNAGFPFEMELTFWARADGRFRLVLERYTKNTLRLCTLTQLAEIQNAEFDLSSQLGLGKPVQSALDFAGWQSIKWVAGGKASYDFWFNSYGAGRTSGLRVTYPAPPAVSPGAKDLSPPP